MVLLSVFSTILIKHKGNRKPNRLTKQGFQRNKFKIIPTIYRRYSTLCMFSTDFFRGSEKIMKRAPFSMEVYKMRV